jgi:hypothetical protein
MTVGIAGTDDLVFFPPPSLTHNDLERHKNKAPKAAKSSRKKVDGGRGGVILCIFRSQCSGVVNIRWTVI